MNYQSDPIVQRLASKTPQECFLQQLQEEFHYAPRIARVILEEAQAHLLGDEQPLATGQMRFLLAKREANPGRPLGETAKVVVTWTVDAGLEDLEVLEAHDAIALRRVRLLRLLDEALAQGGVATQEDLARALQTSVSTIKRDFAALRAEGIYLPSRGHLHGIGRGQTHKAQIVELWVLGATYDQIARRMRHAVCSIQRYVQTFVRVLWLRRQGYSDREISYLLQIGLSLTAEYLALCERYDTEDYGERLDARLASLHGTKAQSVSKKGAR